MKWRNNNRKDIFPCVVSVSFSVHLAKLKKKNEEKEISARSVLVSTFKNILRSTTVSSQGMRMINSEAMSVCYGNSCKCARVRFKSTQSRPIFFTKKSH